MSGDGEQSKELLEESYWKEYKEVGPLALQEAYKVAACGAVNVYKQQPPLPKYGDGDEANENKHVAELELESEVVLSRNPSYKEPTCPGDCDTCLHHLCA